MGKVKVIRVPAGFVLMINRFVVNTLIHCATAITGKKRLMKLFFILLFISISVIIVNVKTSLHY